MTPRTQVISLSVALAALTAVALAVALNRDATAQTATAAEARSAARPALTVRAVAVRSQTWPQTLSATGSVAPWQEVVVGAEIGGQRLHELLVESGDRVKKGQLLARVDPTLQEQAVRDAQAILDGLSAQPGGSSKLCLSCHDGTQAMDNIINAPGSGGYDTTGGGADGRTYTWSGSSVNAAGRLTSGASA